MNSSARQTKADKNTLIKMDTDGINSYLLYMEKSIQSLEKAGTPMLFPKKHVFIESGQFTKYCYIVKKGRVEAFEICPGGEERVYHLHEKNSMFLETNLVFDKPTPVGFRTSVTTEVIRIDKASMMLALKQDPELAFSLFESASNKFFSAMKQVCLVKNYNISWKICDLFLSLADYYGVAVPNGILISEKFSQQTIADLLGINRITAVRAIKKLKDMNLLY